MSRMFCCTILRYSMRKVKRPPPPTWPKDTSVAEAILWASEEISTQLILFAAASRTGSDDHMQEITRKIRAVATRLDQFRRMKLSERAAAASAKSK
jgi:hypothetical protein